MCQLVPQSTGLQTQSNLTRRAGVLWQAGTHFFRIQTVLPKYMIPGTRVNQDHLLDRTEPDSTFALIIMQYEAIPYNTVKYNRANFSKDISSRSLSGNKLCSNTSSLSNSTWMTLPSWLQWNRFSRETKEKLILGFRAKRYLMHKVMLWGGFRWVFPIRFSIAGWRWK